MVKQALIDYINSADEILHIAVSSQDPAVLVDECYFECTKVMVKDYLSNHRNFFNTRTFSKTWSLPSLSRPMILQFLKEHGVRFWPTFANYVLTYPKDPDGLVEGMKKEGILACPQKGPKMDGAFRISFGVRKDTERFISTLEN